MTTRQRRDRPSAVDRKFDEPEKTDLFRRQNLQKPEKNCQSSGKGHELAAVRCGKNTQNLSDGVNVVVVVVVVPAAAIDLFGNGDQQLVAS